MSRERLDPQARLEVVGRAILAVAAHVAGDWVNADNPYVPGTARAVLFDAQFERWLVVYRRELTWEQARDS